MPRRPQRLRRGRARRPERRRALPAPEAGGKLSPAAKRVVEENKLDPEALVGSGRDGRVSKTDVVNYLAAKDAPAPAPAASAPASPPAARAGRAGRPCAARATEQRVPMTRLRARIAERMVQAQATQALLTTFNEVDLTAVQRTARALQGQPSRSSTA